MKLFLASLLLTAAALAENPARIITFNRADTEHCRVILVDGKPMLESTYDNTSVAIGMPAYQGKGEFSVFVSIYQAGNGVAHVVPKDFSALYSDPAHTRFRFYDMAAEIEAQTRAQITDSGLSAEHSQIDPVAVRGAPPAGAPTSGVSPGAGDLSHDTTAPPPRPVPQPLLFLLRSTVKQGTRVAGLVYFREPKGATLQINPTDMLAEIDIPVNGILFRF